jgi:hypothetical protein
MGLIEIEIGSGGREHLKRRLSGLGCASAAVLSSLGLRAIQFPVGQPV